MIISINIAKCKVPQVIQVLGRYMIMTSVLRFAVISVVASTTTAAYSADACWFRYEAAAEQLQDFQTMLMVGTLRCRLGGRAAEANYNDFATRQHNVLGANAYVLKAHYLRENGIQAGRTAYDQNVTLLANKHAARLDDPSFCATVAAYARMAASASSEDLLVLAQSVVEAPVSGPCRTSGAYAEAAALPPMPAYAPPVSYTADPYEAPAPAVAMPATYEPEPPRLEPAPMASPLSPVPAVAAAPSEQAVPVRLAATEIPNAPVIPPAEAAPVVASAPAATPEQALDAAITALQAATAALKARPAPIQH